MKSNFNSALSFILSWEGKLSNDPDDAGGLTYRGITMTHHPDWQGWQYVNTGNYEEADKYVSDFYLEKYWMPAGCEDAEWPMDIILLDTAVNMGQSATSTLMGMSNSWQDYLFNRIQRYADIAKKNNNVKFLRGWINRTMALYRIAKKGG